MKTLNNFINEKLKITKNTKIYKNSFNNIFNEPQELVDTINELYKFDNSPIILYKDNKLTNQNIKPKFNIHSHFEILVNDLSQVNCQIYLQGVTHIDASKGLLLTFRTFQINNNKYEFTSELMNDTNHEYYEFGKRNFKEWLTDVCKKRGYGYDTIRFAFKIKKAGY